MERRFQFSMFWYPVDTQNSKAAIGVMMLRDNTTQNLLSSLVQTKNNRQLTDEKLFKKGREHHQKASDMLNYLSVFVFSK